MVRIVLLLACGLVLTWFHFRGLITHDEGWFLYAGERLLEGDVIYKDFQFVYTPGLVYLVKLSYQLLGISVWSTRVLALFNSLVALLTLTLIAQKLRLPFLSSLFMLLLYLFWGPAHTNFVWPVMFCLTTGLLTSALLLYADSTPRTSLKWWLYFFSGLTTAATGLLKQNFGVALVIANLVYFLIARPSRRQLTFHLSGLLVVGVLQLGYLFSTYSFSWFTTELWFITFEKIIRQGIFNSDLPWNYPGTVFTKLLKFIGYLSPLFISLATLLYGFRRRTSFVHLSLLSLFFFLFSFRPTTDIVHWTPLMALSSVCWVIGYNEVKSFAPQMIVSLLSSILLFLAAYSSLFRNYYGWDTPLIAHNYEWSHPRLGVTVDHKTTVSLQPLIAYLETESPSKQIFVYSFTPSVYFLTDSSNPTRYDYVHRGMITPQLEDGVGRALLSDKVDFVITDHSITLDTTFIAKVIRLRYQADRNFGDFTIWQKKSPTPVLR